MKQGYGLVLSGGDSVATRGCFWWWGSKRSKCAVSICCRFCRKEQTPTDLVTGGGEGWVCRKECESFGEYGLEDKGGGLVLRFKVGLSAV